MMTLRLKRLHRRIAPSRSGGYTIAELLVVMTIMLMLVAITLPAIKNVMQDGNVREASRQLNSYLAMAKARALQTGRPCGVMMICDLPLGVVQDPQNVPNIPPWPTRQITKMYLAEVPPPYSGGTMGAKGRIMLSLNPAAPANTYEFVPLTAGSGGYMSDSSERAFLDSLIAPGETFLVRFDYKGAWFVCQSLNGYLVYQQPGVKVGMTSSGSPTPIPPAMNILPVGSPPVSTLPGYTYQILRLPRRIGNPLELSAGTCIDVAYSGIGPTNLPSGTVRYGMYPADPAALNNTPATNYPGLFPGSPPAPQALQTMSVMFTPGGGIDSIYLNNYFFTPSTTVHFLIGRNDKLTASATAANSSTTHPSTIAMYDPTVSNLADPQSLWVSVARSTGNVITSDNQPPIITSASSGSMTILAGGTTQTITPATDAGQAVFLSYCRQLATNREQARTQ